MSQDQEFEKQVAELKGKITTLAGIYKETRTEKVAQIQSSGASAASGTSIAKPVGKGQPNEKADVLVVQTLLKKLNAPITPDGLYGAATEKAIGAFQTAKFGSADFIISPNGQTFKALLAANPAPAPTPTPTPTPAPATATSIAKPVGKGQPNEKADVVVIQTLLKKLGASITPDGAYGAATEKAIGAFQTAKFGSADFIISPNGQTFKALLAANPAPANNTNTNTTNTNTNTTNTTNTNTTPTNNTANNGVKPEDDPAFQKAIAGNSKLSGSVGQGGTNKAEDVTTVQILLNQFGAKLTINGQADTALIDAIKSFQQKYMGASAPDGRIDAGGSTWRNLLGIGRIQGDLVKLAQQFGVEPAVVLCVQSVESGGNGYFADGRPKILFEGHIFWSQLKKAGKNPEVLQKGNENIIYPKWDKTKYSGGEAEYDRLAKAKKIDEVAALMSTSWGEYQIMGFNHASVGYADVKSFVEAMHKPGSNSLKAVLNFMKSNDLIKHVSGAKKNWAAFAAGYNGPAYAENQYDVKLAAAYERFKKIMG